MRNRFDPAISLLVPTLLGLLAVLHGQDSNWDLRNYHIYGPYAFLHQRLGIDLAPAQVQSYFNPVLDVPYFLMSMHWPPKWVAFAMGFFHGMNFVVVLAITRIVLESTAQPHSSRLAVYLSICAIASSGFLSGLGNTMGDNTTAVLVLAAVLALLHTFADPGQATPRMLVSAGGAGLLLGLAVGLKLTNAIYAVGMCLATLFLPLCWTRRLGMALVFGVGVLVGMLTAGGYWWLQLWRHFGNPLFPLFNSLFKAPLAAQVAAADTRWIPKNIGEALVWPIMTALSPRRLGEAPMWQAVWPTFFVLLLCWGAAALYRRSRTAPAHDASSLSVPAQLVLVFIVLSYIVWMLVFSIARYTIPMAMLTPLAIWIVLGQLFEPGRAKRAAKYTLGACAAVGIIGTNTWGHAAWADKSFRIEMPAFERPERTTVLMASSEPQGFLVPLLPEPVAFISIGPRFPESAAYRARLHEVLGHRNGPVYVLTEAAMNRRRAESIARIDALAAKLGLTATAHACERLSLVIRTLRIHVRIEPSSRPSQGCRIAPLKIDERDLSQANRDIVVRTEQLLSDYRLAVQRESCVVHQAYLGAASYPYQICRVHMPAS